MAALLKVVVVDSDQESRSALRRVLAATPSVVVVSEFSEIGEALRQAPAQVPDIIILEIEDESPWAIEQAARTLPDVAIIATGNSISADFAMRAIRAGAFEFLRRPVERVELAGALDKLARVRRGGTAQARHAARVTSVFSTKGGLGTTTLGVNLSVLMTERSAGGTLLMELNTRQSDVTTWLDLRPRFSIIDAFDNIERMDESFLQGLLVKHASGLWVLPGPTRMERTHLGADQVHAGLEIIRSHFDEVILDLRHDLDPATLAALEASDTILFLTGLDVASLRSGAAGLAAFRHLGLDLNKVKVIVMREGTSDDVTVKHAQQALGIPIFWKTPSDYHTVVASINDGRPVVSASPRSRIAKNLRELADALTNSQAPVNATDGTASRSSSLLRLVWTPKRAG